MFSPKKSVVVNKGKCKRTQNTDLHIFDVFANKRLLL